MSKKNKTMYLTILVFSAAFIWGLFFTYGMDFFWEDFNCFHLDKEEYSMPMDFSSRFIAGVKVLKDFALNAFDYNKLFRVGFGNNKTDRPYLFLTGEFLGIAFGDKIILYRLLKIVFFSINACILFLLINRFSLKLAMFGTLIYITNSELWVSLAYNTDFGIYTQFAMLISILLFMRLIYKEKPLNKKHLWLYYIAILLISNYAVLTRCDGRYLVVLFALTIVFFRMNELKFHAPMLTGLLLINVPVLGFIKKAFTGTPKSPIDIASHHSLPVLESLREIISNDKYPKNALGRPLLILLGITILAHLLSLIFKKIRVFSFAEGNDKYLKERTFIFMTWFFFAFILIALSRSFSYSGPYDWIVSENQFYITPFIIFLCHYTYIISVRFKKPYKSIFIFLCLTLMFGQLVINLPRINRWRGGWGNYFCAWKNVEKFVDSKSNNAIIFTASEMFYKPFVFRNSNNKCRNNLAGSHSLEFVEKTFMEGYQDIFLARRFGLDVKGESENVVLKESIVIDGDTKDLYDRLKRFIGRPSQPVISVNHYVFKAK